MRKPFVLCIVGARRHVGKTTLLIKIVKEMIRRHLSVGTIKHIGDRSAFDLSPRKDTSRHLEGGSAVTLAVTSSEIIVIRKDLPATLDVALSLIPKSLDYVLVEGFRQSGYPKIVLVGTDKERLENVNGHMIAVIVDEKSIAITNDGDQVHDFNVVFLVDKIQDYFGRVST